MNQEVSLMQIDFEGVAVVMSTAVRRLPVLLIS